MKSHNPEFVCTDCAEKSGGKIPKDHLSSWHNGICPCCGKVQLLTQPRDFGYPKLVIKYEYRAVDILGRST